MQKSVENQSYEKYMVLLQFEEGWIEESDDDDGILPWNESMVGELGKLSRLTRLKLAHQVRRAFIWLPL